MEYKKSQIDEIINSDGDLIGDKDTPENGSNMETQASNTTDYNAKVGHQPYRYDMLGRFGFTLLPFFEGVENESPDPLIEDLASHLFEKYKEILEYYFRNPNKIKSDYNKVSKQDYETGDEKYGVEAAEEVLNVIKPHFETAMKDLDKNMKENIDENTFIEGKMLDNKSIDNGFTKEKRGENDVLTKKIEKIAGLINKLDKQDVKKLKNLLEVE